MLRHRQACKGGRGRSRASRVALSNRRLPSWASGGRIARRLAQMTQIPFTEIRRPLCGAVGDGWRSRDEQPAQDASLIANDLRWMNSDVITVLLRRRDACRWFR